VTKVKREEIRVRIAPSPTGFLHVGTARAALFNWLFAKHHIGKFILRIEDTDLERSEKKYEDDIIAGLEWLGLKWDEFYRQSDRLPIYKKYLDKLLKNGKAFWCYHSEEELEAERQEQLRGKDLPRHVCEYKIKNEGSKGRGIIRFAVDENSNRKIIFDDIIRGKVEFEEKLLGDFSIAKDENTPLYNFVVVVDDYEMRISHVIRGEDHISNTPKQIILCEALDIKLPQFAHLPLILGADRTKLSKRHGGTSLIEFRDRGYLPEAMVNFLAFLGWRPAGVEREIITKNELIEKFDLRDIHKAGAVFDGKKLSWVNSQYLKLLNDEGLADILVPYVEKYFGQQGRDKLLKMSSILRERLQFLDQITDFHYFFRRPEVVTELIVWEKSDLAQAKKVLAEVVRWLEVKEMNSEELKQSLETLAQADFKGDRGAVYWPLRVVLSGEKYSADPIQIFKIIGQTETRKRIELALTKI
jgi:glutamyl-tRNA synthetase